MDGTIRSYDYEENSGIISATNGNDYKFVLSSYKGDVDDLKNGMQVQFIEKYGFAKEITPSIQPNDNKIYDLYFEGKILQDKKIDEVKNGFKELGYKEHQVSVLFTGKKRLLKGLINSKEAILYKQLLNGIGAECYFQTIAKTCSNCATKGIESILFAGFISRVKKVYSAATTVSYSDHPVFGEGAVVGGTVCVRCASIGSFGRHKGDGIIEWYGRFHSWDSLHTYKPFEGHYGDMFYDVVDYNGILYRNVKTISEKAELTPDLDKNHWTLIGSYISKGFFGHLDNQPFHITNKNEGIAFEKQIRSRWEVQHLEKCGFMEKYELPNMETSSHDQNGSIKSTGAKLTESKKIENNTQEIENKVENIRNVAQKILIFCVVFLVAIFVIVSLGK